MRLLISIVLFTSLLTACTATLPVNTGWIDIPLADNTYSDSEFAYKEGDYQIDVEAFSALEYKIEINEGDFIVYSWTVEMNDSELLTSEFHGHTERVGDAPGTVMFYTIHNNGKESGSLKAPFTGIHGWYLNNQSDEDISIQIHIAGFYKVI